MEPNLESLIAHRKWEAYEKGLCGKADRVARSLGHCVPQKPSLGYRSSTLYRLEASGLDKDFSCLCTVHNYKYDHHRDVQDYRAEVIVKYAGQVVFSSIGGPAGSWIESFIPGAWEQTLNQLYDQAQKLGLEQEAEKEVVRQRRLEEQKRLERAKWGV